MSIIDQKHTFGFKNTDQSNRSVNSETDWVNISCQGRCKSKPIQTFNNKEIFLNMELSTFSTKNYTMSQSKLESNTNLFSCFFPSSLALNKHCKRIEQTRQNKSNTWANWA